MLEGADSREHFLRFFLRKQADHHASREQHPYIGAFGRSGGKGQVLGGRQPGLSLGRERYRVDPDLASPCLPRNKARISPHRVYQNHGVTISAGFDLEWDHAVGRKWNPGQPGSVGPDLDRHAIDRDPDISARH